MNKFHFYLDKVSKNKKQNVFVEHTISTDLSTILKLNYIYTDDEGKTKHSDLYNKFINEIKADKRVNKDKIIPALKMAITKKETGKDVEGVFISAFLRNNEIGLKAIGLPTKYAIVKNVT